MLWFSGQWDIDERRKEKQSVQPYRRSLLLSPVTATIPIYIYRT